MKKVLLVLGLLWMGYIISGGSGEDECYFDTKSKYGLDKILVSKVVSEEVMKYAKFKGAKTEGVFISRVELGEETIVKVKSTLTAKNGFGVSKETNFIIEASLQCNGYTIISVNKIN